MCCRQQACARGEEWAHNEKPIGENNEDLPAFALGVAPHAHVWLASRVLECQV